MLSVSVAASARRSTQVLSPIRKRVLVQGVAAFAALLISLVANADECQSVVGEYRAVTESEFMIELELRGDMTALVTLTNWNAGEFDQRGVNATEATWSVSGECIVEVTYLEVVDRLKYHRYLSHQHFGMGGASPGLTPIGQPPPDSLIGHHMLWEAKELDAK